jgi:ABC-2 type transport system permease protein
MNQLGLIIQREYCNDIKSKAFWIATFLVPILLIGFGIFIAILSLDSSTLQSVASLGQDQPKDDLSGAQIAGMMVGMFLTLFTMMYGSQIYNKVKTEKTNRIMEIIATCVPGRTMMLGKVIAVGMIGMTQLLTWVVLLSGGVLILTLAMQCLSELTDILQVWKLISGIIYGILYFVGGYLLYGSLFACVGAMSDKDNDNQGYIAILTLMLMSSFYLGEYTVDNPSSQLAIWCTYIPFTSPSIGAVGAISGELSWWESILSLGVLYASAYFIVSMAGKIYTSAMLLNGKKFSMKDILVFIKAK